MCVRWATDSCMRAGTRRWPACAGGAPLRRKAAGHPCPYHPRHRTPRSCRASGCIAREPAQRVSGTAQASPAYRYAVVRCDDRGRGRHAPSGGSWAHIAHLPCENCRVS
ncbi:hypothetical protein BD626DRAFT_513908 [Schizophyllum amplum]|uniref:Uncharacterized protein n=1 Tax=Schizophyllum amplum TaxID=97359 RepID=A0A550BYV9_9AGAR|nr:hypothetical protein BD626DRAFT_513908 [Auriculariopsis ampla]